LHTEEDAEVDAGEAYGKVHPEGMVEKAISNHLANEVGEALSSHRSAKRILAEVY
jgi:hypothetical protein